MYIMRKLNREKKAATDAARAALLADGYMDVTPAVQHGDIPSEKGDPVTREPAKKEKFPAGKNLIKKEKAADTKQKKPDVPAGQGTEEKGNARMPEAAETAESTQKETTGTAAAPEVQQPAEAASPAREQPAELAGSARQFPEAQQNPD